MSKWMSDDAEERQLALEKFMAMPRWVRSAARGAFVFAGPFVVAWAVAWRFCHEFKSCLWHTRQEWRIEVASGREFWRATHPRRRRLPT